MKVMIVDGKIVPENGVGSDYQIISRRCRKMPMVGPLIAKAACLLDELWV